MATFQSLPVELRLCIYEYVFPSETMQSLQYVGFRNALIEPPAANVTITLPTSALVKLYRSNPAGDSKGRFWKPVPLLAVSRFIRAEAEHIWGRLLVTVGTWLSFLSHRPTDLLATIRHVHFHYWVTSKWAPQPPPTHRIDDFIGEITLLWSERMERLQAMMGCHLKKLDIDLTLISPPIFTYRVRKGLSLDTLMLFNKKMPLALEKALLEFGVNGKWPEKEVVVDGTDDCKEPIAVF